MAPPVIFASKKRVQSVDLENKWRELNKTAQGNQDFEPLVIKGAYVIGHIHTYCKIVDNLLKLPIVFPVGYYSAYGIFAAGIELLGRCVSGNPSDTGSSLKVGLYYLADKGCVGQSNKNIDGKIKIVATTKKQDFYSIEELDNLRHYVAHGQATNKLVDTFTDDYEILGALLPKLAESLDYWWEALKKEELLGDNLAVADVYPVWSESIREAWAIFQQDRFGKYWSIQDLFKGFYWTNIR